MKFSIRDLLLATVIVALAVGWWVDHRRQAMEIEKIRRWLTEPSEKMGMIVSPYHYYLEFPPNPITPALNPPKK